MQTAQHLIISRLFVADQIQRPLGGITGGDNTIAGPNIVARGRHRNRLAGLGHIEQPDTFTGRLKTGGLADRQIANGIIHPHRNRKSKHRKDRKAD